MNLLLHLSEKDWKLGKREWIKKGVILFKEQDVCNEIIFIVEGEIKIASYDEMGREDIYNYLNTGNFFGNALIFASSKKYLGNVITMKKTEIFRLNESQFIQLLSQNKPFLTDYLKVYAEEMYEAKTKIKMFSKHSIAEKILYYLSIHNNSLHCTIQKLSEELFLPRPSVSRVLSMLIREQKICKTKNTISLIR